MAPTERVGRVLPTAKHMLTEGASYGEVSRTVGVSRATLRYWLPGSSSWSVRDGGVFAAACREMRRVTGLKVWSGMSE